LLNEMAELVVCDSSSGQQIGNVDLPSEPAAVIRARRPMLGWDAEVSPDGHEFATAISTPQQTWVLAWDLATGSLTYLREVKVRRRQGMVRSVMQPLDGSAGWLMKDGSVALERQSGRVRWISPLQPIGLRARILPGNRCLQEVRQPGSRARILITDQVQWMDEDELSSGRNR
jgi:hypothetical protein